MAYGNSASTGLHRSFWSVLSKLERALQEPLEEIEPVLWHSKVRQHCEHRGMWDRRPKVLEVRTNSRELSMNPGLHDRLRNQEMEERVLCLQGVLAVLFLNIVGVVIIIIVPQPTCS
ncbi:hypothetical protein BDV24DRAFT_135603 [Aspergillus arachidicola]|uniref:Uncharacterized protein n=1 Tax=Aspergillus arachidicola TaxID=656916 RepID=A0A5N6Y3A4_9EURO|nr:hypothetical protein BDV24DRAFT_135603 [Aspergillus arachidicola]